MSKRCAERSAATLVHRLSSCLSRHHHSEGPRHYTQAYLPLLAHPSSPSAPSASSLSHCRSSSILPALPLRLPWPLLRTETAPVRLWYSQGMLQTDLARALLREHSSLSVAARERVEIVPGVPLAKRHAKGKRKRGDGSQKGTSEPRGPPKKKGIKDRGASAAGTGLVPAKEQGWRSAIIRGGLKIPDHHIPSYVWTVLNRLTSQGDLDSSRGALTLHPLSTVRSGRLDAAYAILSPVRPVLASEWRVVRFFLPSVELAVTRDEQLVALSVLCRICHGQGRMRSWWEAASATCACGSLQRISMSSQRRR